MKNKTLCTVISIVMGAVLLYGWSWTIYYAFKGYQIFNSSLVLNSITGIIGITGLLIFTLSKFKKSGLLRMFMCMEVFSFPFTVWYYINFFTRDNDFSYVVQPKISALFIVGIFTNLLFYSACFIGLWVLNKSRVANVTYVEYGNKKMGQFVPATGGLRFANRLIDMLVVVFILVTRFIANRLFMKNFELDNYQSFYLIEIPAILIYYLLLEGIFNTTAGKSATNTIIVNENGNRPHFGQILGRTFCRLIPFEPFSFLGAGARGWHDTLTGTYVVDSVAEDELAMNEITFDAEQNIEQA